jgi:DNA-binding MarR family transcriptional regulator
MREEFGLSVSEYVMCDIIHGLSGNRGAVPGWCYASRETLGKNLGITRQGAQKIIDRLIEMQLVEVDAETNYLRTTERWIYAVELQKQQVYRDADHD